MYLFSNILTRFKNPYKIKTVWALNFNAARCSLMNLSHETSSSYKNIRSGAHVGRLQNVEVQVLKKAQHIVLNGLRILWDVLLRSVIRSLAHSRFHSLASWFIATITGWGTGATQSSSFLSRLGSGSSMLDSSVSMLEGLLTSTGGDVEAWAARIWRGLVRAEGTENRLQVRGKEGYI